MPRAVPEWQGRTPESMPPKTVFDRLWDKQDGKDAITGIPFTSKDRIVRDHIVPLIDGGENCESNLQLITEGTHKAKTIQEANRRAKERRVRSNARGYDRGEKSRLQGPGFGRRPSNARELYGDVPEAERGEK
jgi:5-methylcytosine-specific restriction protein A